MELAALNTDGVEPPLVTVVPVVNWDMELALVPIPLQAPHRQRHPRGLPPPRQHRPRALPPPRLPLRAMCPKMVIVVLLMEELHAKDQLLAIAARNMAGVGTLLLIAEPVVSLVMELAELEPPLPLHQRPLPLQLEPPPPMDDVVQPTAITLAKDRLLEIAAPSMGGVERQLDIAEPDVKRLMELALDFVSISIAPFFNFLSKRFL